MPAVEMHGHVPRVRRRITTPSRPRATIANSAARLRIRLVERSPHRSDARRENIQRHQNSSSFTSRPISPGAIRRIACIDTHVQRHLHAICMGLTPADRTATIIPLERGRDSEAVARRCMFQALEHINVLEILCLGLARLCFLLSPLYSCQVSFNGSRSERQPRTHVIREQAPSCR
jgi:hypothetical protein